MYINRMLALVTSHSANNLDVYNASLLNHTEYCRRHDYALIANDETYNPRLNVDQMLWLLKIYDVVVTMGCDLLIQHPAQPLTDFVSPVISICPEILSGTLNADFIVYHRSPLLMNFLHMFRQRQGAFPDSQQLLNVLYQDGNQAIRVFPKMQLASPLMNSGVDYSGINIEDYFALHFHTVGSAPNPVDKAEKMRTYCG